MRLAAVIVFTVTVMLSLGLTALVRAVAPRLGLVDRPDNHRKLHGRPIALGGGLAVFLTMALVLGGLLLVPNPWQLRLWLMQRELAALLVAGAFIVGVGLIDDRFRLRGRVKLLGQLAAALLLTFGGLLIERISLFGVSIDLGLLAVPFTLFWLLGAMNAVNLLDGIDGLAAMLGLILVATIGVMSLFNRHYDVLVIALVLASSLMGFLRFNFPPATIFLGDAGSMLIGLVVGALAIRGALKGPGTVLLAAPLAVWTIPILDSIAAVMRRKLTGRSIYTTDRGHLHHRLMQLLGSNRKVLALVGCVCAMTSVATLVSVAYQNDIIALVACSAIVIMLISTGMFGRAELALLTTRLRQFSHSLLEPADAARSNVRQSSVRLQGTRAWESLWSTLTDSAEKLALCEIRLEVNAPRMHEGYHAFWECPMSGSLEERWHIEIPLIVGEQVVGCLSVVGQHRGRSACEDIERLLGLLEPFETQLRALTEQKVLVPVAQGGTAYAQQPRASTATLVRTHPK